jgi:Arc/MetJ-type ribon-helix-helix transcriptional regulator
MAARNVSLTDHLDEFVDASEGVREALRRLERQRRYHDIKLQAPRQALEVGRQDAAAGRTVIVEEGRIGAKSRAS